ncbi:MAG: HEAT repeat domain-containing protein [Verrucomicrobiia bacterium]
MNSNTWLTLMLLGCWILPLSSDGAGLLIKRETILLAGKTYRLEESIPVISCMLKSSVESEQLTGLEGVRGWAWQLRGRDLVIQVIDLYNSTSSHGVKVTALAALCAARDGRAEKVFEQAATSPEEFFKFGGLIGLAEHRGPEMIPQLVEAMVSTETRMMVTGARVALIGLVDEGFCWPPKEAWKSEAEKKKYLQKFAQWWEANKARLDTEWKAQRAADAKRKPHD